MTGTPVIPAPRDPTGLFEKARETVLAALPDALAIYVFGSFAKGEAWPSSDLDLAVLLPPATTIPDLLGLQSDLACSVGREVDVVDLRRAGDVLRGEVLRSGLTIYEAEHGTVLGWEAEVMTRYGEYRREVREILEDFESTGVGYAE
jgi:uncharacterized protein